jgi:PAS domain-containing protein
MHATGIGPEGLRHLTSSASLEKLSRIRIRYQRMCRMVEACRMGKLVADREGRYLDADDAALELLGITLEELRSMRVGDFSGPHAEMAATVWRRLAAGGQDMSSGEGTLYLPHGGEIRVRYERIRALPSGDYELSIELMGSERTERPPTSDRPSTILREWRVAQRELEATASDGPGAMAAPDEANEAVDKLRRLYQDSVAARTEPESDS